jgi:hypothetical protein
MVTQAMANNQQVTPEMYEAIRRRSSESVPTWEELGVQEIPEEAGGAPPFLPS